MTGILDRIVSDKRARIGRGEYSVPPGAAARPDGGRFLASLRETGPRVIAEIKHRSPSAGEILPGAEGKIETLALAYRRGHAAAISVVTEEDHFGGKAEWMARAKRISGLPMLMKDFFLEPLQLDFAAARGADAVLLIARALSAEALAGRARAARERGLATVVEAHNREEIVRAAESGADVIGVNARDLGTFATDLAAVERMGREIRPGPVRLAESGIASHEDVVRLTNAGYGAFLVGEALLRHEDPEQLLRELIGW
jgi:indole-3-glycerol phosphate synthase